MDFMQLIQDRYSVRAFDPRPVGEEALQAILEAGRLAPTATNAQPQRILVIQSEAGREKLKTCTRFTFDAPLVLIICYDRGVCWKNARGEESGTVDASIVTTHMMLAAVEQGLGSTWVGSFDHAALRTAFDIPQHIEPVALLPLGYPAAHAAPSAKHTQRLPMEHSVFHEAF